MSRQTFGNFTDFLICSFMTIVDKYASSWRQEIKSEKGSGLKRFRPSSDWQIEEFNGTCGLLVIVRMKVTWRQRVFVTKFFLKKLCKSSLTQQPTFGYAATCFHAKRSLRNSAEIPLTANASLPRSG